MITTNAKDFHGNKMAPEPDSSPWTPIFPKELIISPDWHDDIPNNFQHEFEQEHPMKAHSRRFLDH